MTDTLADWKEPEQTEAERRAAFVERMTDNEGVLFVPPGEPLPPMPPGPKPQVAPMTRAYKVSEGVIMRAFVPGAHALEAWSPKEQAWYEYPDILKNWIYADRDIPESKVPAEALTAPSLYHEVTDADGHKGWDRIVPAKR